MPQAADGVLWLFCNIFQTSNFNFFFQLEQQIKERRLYLKCRKYLRRTCRLQEKVKKLKNLELVTSLSEAKAVKSLAKRMSPSFALLLQGQIKNYAKKPQGQRWTEDAKLIALRLYKRSPSCYRLLRRMFSLPAPSTLKRLLSRLDMPIGINKRVMEVLKNIFKDKTFQ